MAKRRFIALLLLIGVVSVYASTVEAQRTRFSHSSAAVANSSTIVLPQNGNRNFLLLINMSDTMIWCKFGGAVAVAGEGVPLAPAPAVTTTGGSIFLDYKFSIEEIRCTHGGSGNKTININEGRQ